MPLFCRDFLRDTAIVLASAMLLGSAACSSEDTSATGAGAGAGPTSSASSSQGSGGSTSSSTGSSMGGGGAGAVCPGMGYGGDGVAEAGGTVQGTLVDVSGAPVAGQPLYICGTDLCSPPAKSGSQGEVMIATNTMMKKRAFKFGDALTYAELSIPLTMATSDFGTITTGKLPAQGAALAPGGDAASGGVTVSIPAGASVVVDELVYDTPDKQLFRAVEIPVAKAKPVLDPVMIGGMAANFEILYGVAPAQTTICPAAKITVPNAPGWPAGTAVEFWITTVATAQEYAPYAGWAKASDGEVSADGMTVSTSAAGGFIYLDTFAVRKAP